MSGGGAWPSLHAQQEERSWNLLGMVGLLVFVADRPPQICPGSKASALAPTVAQSSTGPKGSLGVRCLPLGSDSYPSSPSSCPPKSNGSEHHVTDARDDGSGTCGCLRRCSVSGLMRHKETFRTRVFKKAIFIERVHHLWPHFSPGEFPVQVGCQQEKAEWLRACHFPFHF